MSASPARSAEPAGSFLRVVPESLESIREAARTEAASQHPARSSAALQVYAARLLAGELARCERAMTPGQWVAHREWIEENARASLRAALNERIQRGQL
jgi:hypothetical protein